MLPTDREIDAIAKLTLILALKNDHEPKPAVLAVPFFLPVCFAKHTKSKGGCLFQVKNTKHLYCCTSACVCFALSDCLFRFFLFFGRLANVVYEAAVPLRRPAWARGKQGRVEPQATPPGPCRRVLGPVSEEEPVPEALPWSRARALVRTRVFPPRQGSGG